MDFITSDLHLGHKNIYGPNGFVSTRKHFQNVEEMNEYLIEAHNSVVTQEDTTYHLGDFSLHMSNEEIFETLSKMNGQFHIIKGNHDSTRMLNYLEKNNYKLSSEKWKFVTHCVGTIIKKDSKIYHLTHYPLQLGGRRRLRSLCGHIHESAVDLPYSLNVGIDSPELPEEHPFGVPLEFDVACVLLEKKIKRLYKVD